MADPTQALTEVLARFGVDALVAQPNLCRNTLRDKLPNSPREASLLVTALEGGVPTRLQVEARISDVDTVAAHLAGGLERSYGLSPDSARWAVQTWAAALGLSGARRTTSGNGGDGPSGAATQLRIPTGDVTALPPVPPPPGGTTAAPLPAWAPSVVPPGPFAPTGVREPTGVRQPSDIPQPSGIRQPSGPATVLRGAPGAGAGSFSPPTPPPPRRGGRGRRWGGILAVVVVLAIVAGVVAVILGRSGGGSHHAAGAGTSAGSHSSGAASSTASAATDTFAPISPVLAHRGDHEGYPEETLPAFVQAGQRGFTVETDVRWTKDGVPVITHDATTGNGMICRGGPLVVAATTWAVLHSSCGTSPAASKDHRAYGIPTLDDTVEALSRIHGATLFAELKIDQSAVQNKAYLAILRKWKMTTRTVATSFDSTYLQHFMTEATAEHTTVRTLRFAASAAPTTLADLQGTHVWGVVFTEPWDEIPTLASQARRAGIEVGIATLGSAAGSSLDGPTEWERAKQLGAAFVLTDRPSAYHSWLEQH